MVANIRRIFFFSVIVLSGAAFMNCDVPLTFELDEIFSLAYQQTKENTAEDITIKFEQVVADSRCPVDVVCVWAGNAEVLFTFTKGSDSSMFSLNTSLDPQEVTMMGYTIKMVGLQPTEILSTNPPDQKDYIASMIITKSDVQGCKDNYECGKNEFCKKAVGDCNGIGQCAEIPIACITLWDPQCGCDGKTYGNSCNADAAGVNIAHVGECRDTSCDDGSQVTCKRITPECSEYEILAIQNNCWVCVNPQTCLPWGVPQCKTDEECKSGICDPCGTSSCPVCDDCVSACVEK